MPQRTIFFLALLSLLLLTAPGCDDDSGANNNNINNTNNTNSPVCGDGQRDTGEECDGAALGGTTCETLGQGFTGGVLTCDGECHYDTSACTDACTNACVPGSTECQGDTRRACEVNEGTGCTRWADTDCALTGGTCVVIGGTAQCDVCSDECALGDERCNDMGNGIDTCVAGVDGCTEWSAESCPPDTPACQETEGTAGCVLLCPTTFVYNSAESINNVRVTGEWQGFDLTTSATMTGPDADGNFTATIPLPPGLNAYKIVHQGGSSSDLCSWDGSSNLWCLDHGQVRRKYIGGIENSAVLVPDCSLPSLQVSQSEAAYNGSEGSYSAQLTFVDGIEESGPDAAGYEATLVKDFVSRSLSGSEFTVAGSGDVTISLTGLETGKYRVVLRPYTQSGKMGNPLRLIFWIEAEPFSWDGALIYMVMTDRFVDGDTSNTPLPTPGAEPTGDWHGGDLAGLAAKIADGTLDALGVRAIWLTPFQTNPTGAYLASDGVHLVTGYHGYWPVKAREVDPRLGGEDALRNLVTTAHAHGIRILQDFVLNHVHEDHEYNLTHPEWFRTGCVCGTAGCDWTGHALDCMFTSYMPDIDHTVTEANNQFVADGVWWLDEMDLDGLRVDAVKHVEEIATRNLSAAVRETFEAAGTRYFLMGETAMGWNDCADPCNDENYGTISKYIGPHGLDGQFDFVLYHGVSYSTFAYGDQGMLHADYWVQHGLSKWPEGAVMTPYIGSHDTARFASLADYRGQDAAHERWITGNQWDNLAGAPTDAEPYRRMRIAMTWLLGLPGAPLLYYGDEYGQWGGVDPNNRMMWREGGALTAHELETLTYIRKLGMARRNLPALHHGAYISLGATEDNLVFARYDAATGDVAIVGLTRATTAQPTTVSVASLGLTEGTVLYDHLSSYTATVAADLTVTIDLPAGSGLVLAP